VIDLIDAAGAHHTPVPGPARILSLVPSVTELLFHLGLGDQVVGRTGFCVHPVDAVDSVPKVGGTKTPDLDKIRALAPTHVVLNVDENPRALAGALADCVPHVVVTHPMAVEDNPGLYRLLGALFDRRTEAQALCAEFERAYARVVRVAGDWPHRRVLYLIWRDPYMSVSRDTYISRTLALVRWNTVADDPADRYPTLTDPGPALDDADLVIFASEPYPFKPKHLAMLREAYSVGGKQLVMMDAEMVSWYGSRAIPGLDYLGAFVPEVNSGAVPA
jgi:ABC-type Fe3+-hydroxamate transport system substrate-binding protein